MKTYYLVIVSAIVISIFTNTVSACTNPFDRTSAGIVFNNGENLNLSRLKSIGKEGVNYYSRQAKIAIPQSGIKDINILTPTTDPVNWNDPVQITSIDFFNNFMFVDVSYGGGCTTHEFILYADSLLSGSDPVKCRLTLLHNAHGDACKALISETLCFNIAPFQKIHPDIAPVKFVFNNSGPYVFWYPDNAEAIMYRSHYDNSAMVYLTYSSLYNNSKSGKFPVMRICTDTGLVYESPLHYGDYVTNELKFLINNKIIENPKALHLEKIGQSIGTKNCQYWTLQDSALTYGSYFQYNLDSTGTYIWDAAIPDMRDCSESLPFLIPPQPFETTSILASKVHKTITSQNVTAVFKGNMVYLNRNDLKPGMSIEVIDLRGTIVDRNVLKTDQNTFYFTCKEMIPAGVYYIRTCNGKSRIVSNMFKLR